jgi:hypothetical protein
MISSTTKRKSLKTSVSPSIKDLAPAAAGLLARPERDVVPVLGLAARPDRPPGLMTSVAGGEMRTLRPGREIGIRAPASQHGKDIAIVVWLQQFEALEALGVRHILGGRAEPAHELAEVPRVAP